MEKYLEIFKKIELFKDIKDTELKSVLNCIGAEVKNVKKGEIVLLTGDKPQHVGVILAGRLHIIQEDYDGNRTLMNAVEPGEIFAEALCCAGVLKSPVTVVAELDSVIMLLNFAGILHICPSVCAFHTKLVGNMLEIIAKKTLILQSRMEIIGLKSVRMKVTRYLESFMPNQTKEITIPFNREEMADFLCVERSALSHELARMKKDGLIEYKKNKFIIP